MRARMAGRPARAQGRRYRARCSDRTRPVTRATVAGRAPFVVPVIWRSANSGPRIVGCRCSCHVGRERHDAAHYGCATAADRAACAVLRSPSIDARAICVPRHGARNMSHTKPTTNGQTVKNLGASGTKRSWPNFRGSWFDCRSGWCMKGSRSAWCSKDVTPPGKAASSSASPSG